MSLGTSIVIYIMQLSYRKVAENRGVRVFSRLRLDFFGKGVFVWKISGLRLFEHVYFNIFPPCKINKNNEKNLKPSLEGRGFSSEVLRRIIRYLLEVLQMIIPYSSDFLQ